MITEPMPVADHGDRSVAAVLRRTGRLLIDGGSPSPAAEARTLLAHVLGVELGALVLAPPLQAAQLEALTALVRRRIAGEPLQHLTGEAWFRTVRLEVGPGVFTPRPETEVMTGWAVDWLRRRIADGVAAPVVVELGAGSGAISAAVSAEVPAALVHAVELSEDALAWASKNLSRHGVDLRHGDLADAFPDLDRTVDLVISNPPYIPLEHWDGVAEEVRTHEPHLALFSGPDGLTAMRQVAATAHRLLRVDGPAGRGGVVAAEHAEVQADSAPAVFIDHGGFVAVVDHRDLTGRPRFVTAQRSDSGRMER
ncbi:peptide chain release factor N(5)-glutamine methyltransferase [Naumannella halotolerans]|uniref:peptide chain release factor N(5)-glutamine methyltransferase n=1 Tax=Naumannella halotolerans TaxID=993414 RepID=UPI00370D1B40